MVLNNREAHGDLNPTSVVMWLGVNGRDAPRMAVAQDQARVVAHCLTGESPPELHAPDVCDDARQSKR